MVLGYALSTCVKPVFPLADSILVVLVARLFDRTGKGVRDAPRDALLADQLPSRVRGAGFGLRISLFTVGMVLGPMLAAAIMTASERDFRLVFWIAVVPAVLSVIVLVTRVEEMPSSASEPKPRLDLRSLTLLPPAYWWVIAVGCMIALARFSQAFLLLKANAIGVGMAHVPLYLALVGLVYGLSAYPFGILADCMDRRIQLGGGVVTLAVCHLVLAFADTGSVLILGSLLWGLQLGMIDGLLGASIADTTPQDLRGTGFGVYHLCVGLPPHQQPAREVPPMCWPLQILHPRRRSPRLCASSLHDLASRPLRRMRLLEPDCRLSSVQAGRVSRAPKTLDAAHLGVSGKETEIEFDVAC